MAATPFIDRVDTLECVEHLGVIKSLTRVARVKGLESTDYTVLAAALLTAGVPQTGASLPGFGFEALILTERSAKLVDGDKGVLDVTLKYNHILEGPNQNFSNPQGGIIYGKTRCSVQQTHTNFYREAGVGPIQQIVLAHQFPITDPDVPLRVITQGGEITVQTATRNMHFDGYLDTLVPWNVANLLIGAINANTWASQGPYEWMCTEVQWDILKAARYHFSFEFAHTPDTWNPTAVFNDERTGKPPPGLIPNVGYKYIRYHKELNFNLAFNAFFEGWQQLI